MPLLLRPSEGNITHMGRRRPGKLGSLQQSLAVKEWKEIREEVGVRSKGKVGFAGLRELEELAAAPGSSSQQPEMGIFVLQCP